MTLIEHARLVLEHKLDDVYIGRGGDAPLLSGFVHHIATSPNGGYVIHYTTTQGHSQQITTSPGCLRDSDVRFYSREEGGATLFPLKLMPLSGESASTLLADFGVDVTQLNEHLIAARRYPHTASEDF